MCTCSSFFVEKGVDEVEKSYYNDSYDGDIKNNLNNSDKIALIKRNLFNLCI